MPDLKEPVYDLHAIAEALDDVVRWSILAGIRHGQGLDAELDRTMTSKPVALAIRLIHSEIELAVHGPENLLPVKK